MSQTTFTMTQVTCAFCKGTGKDPFELLSGAFHGTRITCTVCNGKGMVTVSKGLTKQCPECKGTGTAIDSGLPCLCCKGKGVIAK